MEKEIKKEIRKRNEAKIDSEIVPSLSQLGIHTQTAHTLTRIRPIHTRTNEREINRNSKRIKPKKVVFSVDNKAIAIPRSVLV